MLCVVTLASAAVYGAADFLGRLATRRANAAPSSSWISSTFKE
jgi:hypothetical protein